MILCCFWVLIYDRRTDGRTDICTSRVAFATENDKEEGQGALVVPFLLLVFAKMLVDELIFFCGIIFTNDSFSVKGIIINT